MEPLRKVEGEEMYELILNSGEEPSKEDIEKYEKKGFFLFDVQEDIEFDDPETEEVEIKDIYYFVNENHEGLDDHIKLHITEKIMELEYQIDHIEDLPDEYQTPALWEEHAELEEHAEKLRKLIY